MPSDASSGLTTTRNRANWSNRTPSWLCVEKSTDGDGGDDCNVIAKELIPLDQLDSRYTRGIIVRVDEQKHGEEGLKNLREILRGYPGGCELQLLLQLADGSKVHLKCDKMSVELGAEMRNRVDDLLGPGNFRLLTNKPPHECLEAASWPFSSRIRDCLLGLAVYSYLANPPPGGSRGTSGEGELAFDSPGGRNGVSLRAEYMPGWHSKKFEGPRSRMTVGLVVRAI